MKTRILYILSFMLILIFCSCSKNEPIGEPKRELPAITTEGLGTFGCLVNGEVWLPYSDVEGPLTPSLSASYSEASNSLSIFGMYRDSDLNFQQYIYIRTETEGEGTFHIAGPPSNEWIISQSHVEFNCSGYKTPYLNTEIRILRLDTINDIVSGTFNYGWGYNECGDSIRIEDGRFDLKYRL